MKLFVFSFFRQQSRGFSTSHVHILKFTDTLLEIANYGAPSDNNNSIQDY